EAETVSLSKEMQFISDFTRLMSLRLNPSVKLTCELPEIQDNSMRIAPLLILTIVENAFKHVAVVEDGGFINIRIKADDEYLRCKVENSSMKGENKNLEKGASGIGLRNIEKQLNLLYPNAYRLNIENESGVFISELSIKSSALRSITNNL
ncbi:MAG: GHKL domain-containing protein, partial [Muribaculaceae bacterium]|nr:GHKL domain-containing protein [Muribaculaceae bacterium]